MPCVSYEWRGRDPITAPRTTPFMTPSKVDGVAAQMRRQARSESDYTRLNANVYTISRYRYPSPGGVYERSDFRDQ